VRGCCVNQRHPLRSRDQPRKLVGERGDSSALDQYAPRRHARLTCIGGVSKEHCARRCLRIGICQHKRGIRARKFKRAREKPSCTDFCDRTPYRCRAGEDNMIESLIAKYARALLTRGCANFNHPAHGGDRARRFHRQFKQSHLRAWSALRGLHNHRVPRNDRLHDLNAEKLDGVVPRRNDEHPTNGKSTPLNCMTKPEKSSATNPHRVE
jgi:hypothetical protein